MSSALTLKYEDLSSEGGGEFLVFQSNLGIGHAQERYLRRYFDVPSPKLISKKIVDDKYSDFKLLNDTKVLNNLLNICGHSEYLFEASKLVKIKRYSVNKFAHITFKPPVVNYGECILNSFNRLIANRELGKFKLEKQLLINYSTSVDSIEINAMLGDRVMLVDALTLLKTKGFNKYEYILLSDSSNSDNRLTNSVIFSSVITIATLLMLLLYQKCKLYLKRVDN